jgi:sRNA-binding regulator protein Hfq
MAAACEVFIDLRQPFPPVTRLAKIAINPVSIFGGRNHVNRKLIRTTLAEVKGKTREAPPPRERNNGGAPRQSEGSREGAPRTSPAPSVQLKKRTPPPLETNAEIFYYKKQIDAHTPMVIVLLDGEEIEGTIEWYDRGALKVNRKTGPNLLVLKRNIKYMYKADERVVEQAQ